MEIGAKTIAAGVGLFFLGGLSVYLLTANTGANTPEPKPAQHQSLATQETQLGASNTQGTIRAAESTSNATAGSATSSATEELTHDAFLAQAEARREQQLIDNAEADRLAKLRATKERSVECKFWKQQQKTSSAAAKIEEKIIHYCTLQTSSSTSSHNSSLASSTANPAS